MVHGVPQNLQLIQIVEVVGVILTQQQPLEELLEVAGARLIMLLPLQVDGVQQQKMRLQLEVGVNQINLLTIQEVDGVNLIKDTKMEIVKEVEAEAEEVIEVAEAKVIIMIEEKDHLLRGINQIQSP